jgi:DNA-binding CsgD family transcriptional regulator
MTTVVPTACFAFVFGNIHFRWIQLQDGAMLSMLIQLGIACGSALGGLLILALARFFWNRDSIEVYKVFVLPVVILALWLSSFVNEGWIFLYLALLNIAHKLVFLFIMLTPFMLRLGRSRLALWCLAYLSFTAGKTVSSLLLMHMTSAQSTTSSLISLGLLLICSMLPTLLANASTVNKAADFSLEAGKGTGNSSTMKLHNATRTLARRYSLTGREEEILVLLARGRTAKHVAEALVISQLTAKTHQKNIYSKMQIHGQQELISLIEATIDEQRSRQ